MRVARGSPRETVIKLSADAVLALAPDAASASAARGLLAPAKWPSLGANDEAAWGECQGSGSKPYRTQVDLGAATPAFRCTCPSRKFPCKHGLALLLLRAQQESLFTASEAPAWVREWLSDRAEKEQKKEEKQREKAAVVDIDPDEAAERERKRQHQRWARITGAANDLQAWLGDQLGRGLGAVGDEQRAAWHTMAARLVDGQASGLAARVREAAVGIRQGADWPERLLHRLGLLQSLCDAIARREQLSPELQAELRNVIGWPYDKSEVLASGERLTDRWTVLGQISEEGEDSLIERRVWLHGEHSGQRALLLDHAFGGRGFEQSWLSGTAFDGSLVFFPGSKRLRALVAEITAAATALWPENTADDEWLALARRVAASPWVRQHPLVLTAATPCRQDDGLCLNVGEQRLPLRLGEADTWNFLACSGGHALWLMGEWDGWALHPLTARGADGLWLRSSP